MKDKMILLSMVCFAMVFVCVFVCIWRGLLRGLLLINRGEVFFVRRGEFGLFVLFCKNCIKKFMYYICGIVDFIFYISCLFYEFIDLY